MLRTATHMGTKRLSTTISMFAPLLLLAAAGLAGCSADTEGEDGATDGTAAQTGTDAGAKNPTYEAVLKRAKVVSNATPGGATSAETTLLGYVPKEKVEDTLAKLLGVRHWTEIQNDDGSAVFTATRVASDDNGATKRTVKANVTLSGDISLDTKVVAEKQDDGSQKITITNTSGYRHWLAGQVLDPGKLVIEIKLVPYQDGVIVDAHARVKLDVQENQAPTITAYIVPIFNWLKAN